MATGTKRGDLYALDSQKLALFSHCFRKITMTDKNIIQFLQTSSLISMTDKNKMPSICSSCQMGISCRLTFLPSENKCE